MDAGQRRVVHQVQCQADGRSAGGLDLLPVGGLGLGAGHHESADKAGVGGVNQQVGLAARARDAEIAIAPVVGRAVEVADHGLSLAGDGVDANGRADTDLGRRRQAAGHQGQGGAVDGLDQRADPARDLVALGILLLDFAGANIDESAVINLRHGHVVDRIHQHHTVDRQVLGLAAGGADADGQGGVLGRHVQAVAEQAHVVFDDGLGVVVEVIDLHGDTHGTAGLVASRAACLVLLTELAQRAVLGVGRRFLLPIAEVSGGLEAELVQANGLDVAAQVDGVDDVDRRHRYRLLAAAPAGSGLLVDFGAVLDRRECVVVVAGGGHRARHRRLGGAFGKGLVPDVGDLAVQTKVAVETRDELLHEDLDRIRGEIDFLPARRVAKILCRGFERGAVDADEAVGLSAEVGVGVVVSNLYRVAGRQHRRRVDDRAVAGHVLRLEVLVEERRHQVRTPQLGGVDLVDGRCLYGDGLFGVDVGVALDGGGRGVVVDAYAESQRDAVLGSRAIDLDVGVGARRVLGIGGLAAGLGREVGAIGRAGSDVDGAVGLDIRTAIGDDAVADTGAGRVAVHIDRHGQRAHHRAACLGFGIGLQAELVLDPVDDGLQALVAVAGDLADGRADQEARSGGLDVVELVAGGIGALAGVGTDAAGCAGNDEHLVLGDRFLLLCRVDDEVATDIDGAVEPGVGGAVLDVDADRQRKVAFLAAGDAGARDAAVHSVGLDQQVPANGQVGVLLDMHRGLRVHHRDGKGQPQEILQGPGDIGKHVDDVVGGRAQGGVVRGDYGGVADRNVGIGDGHADGDADRHDEGNRLGEGEHLRLRSHRQIHGVDRRAAVDADARGGLGDRDRDLQRQVLHDSGQRAQRIGQRAAVARLPKVAVGVAAGHLEMLAVRTGQQLHGAAVDAGAGAGNRDAGVDQVDIGKAEGGELGAVLRLDADPAMVATVVVAGQQLCALVDGDVLAAQGDVAGLGCGHRADTGAGVQDGAGPADDERAGFQRDVAPGLVDRGGDGVGVVTGVGGLRVGLLDRVVLGVSTRTIEETDAGEDRVVHRGRVALQHDEAAALGGVDLHRLPGPEAARVDDVLVEAAAALERVLATACAKDHVATEAVGVQGVGAAASGEFGALYARQGFVAAAHVQRRVRQREVHVARLDQGVDACTTRDAVLPGPAGQAVVAAAADERVVAGLAVQHHRGDADDRARQRAPCCRAAG